MIPGLFQENQEVYAKGLVFLFRVMAEGMTPDGNSHNNPLNENLNYVPGGGAKSFTRIASSIPLSSLAVNLWYCYICILPIVKLRYKKFK